MDKKCQNLSTSSESHSRLRNGKKSLFDARQKVEAFYPQFSVAKRRDRDSSATLILARELESHDVRVAFEKLRNCVA